MFSTSIIVCAYTEKRWDDLISALDSLCQQSLKPGEIILVIDHNEALYARASETFSDVTLLKNQHERGLSGARNTGIEQAKGDIIAFMDEDAAAEPNWLEKLVDHYQDNSVVGVGGQIIPTWLNSEPRWFPAEFHWVVGCTYTGMPETAAQVRNLIGCNMSFRREVFEQIGVFREGIGRVDTLPVGCEETELCIRVNQKWSGRHLLYEPQAKVLHRVPDSRANWRYYFSRCFSEGISKALISRYIGVKDALSTERDYVRKTLPSGVLHGFSDSLRGDITGIERAFAITAGLMMTGFGYVVGKMGQA